FDAIPDGNGAPMIFPLSAFITTSVLVLRHPMKGAGARHPITNGGRATGPLSVPQAACWRRICRCFRAGSDFPVPLRVDLLLPPSQHVLRRDVARAKASGTANILRGRGWDREYPMDASFLFGARRVSWNSGQREKAGATAQAAEAARGGAAAVRG